MENHEENLLEKKGFVLIDKRWMLMRRLRNLNIFFYLPKSDDTIEYEVVDSKHNVLTNQVDLEDMINSVRKDLPTDSYQFVPTYGQAIL